MTEWPSREDELVDLLLMFTRWTSDILNRPAMSISLSKWPMLPTIA